MVPGIYRPRKQRRAFFYIDRHGDSLAAKAGRESLSRDWEPHGHSRPVREDGPAMTASLDVFMREHRFTKVVTLRYAYELQVLH